MSFDCIQPEVRVLTAQLERANADNARLTDEVARLRRAGHAMRHLHLDGKPCTVNEATAAWDAVADTALPS